MILLCVRVSKSTPPVKSKAITIRSEAEWYTEEIHKARRICSQRTRPDTAARQPSSMCKTISCVQWTRGRWASFSSSTCRPLLKLLIIEHSDSRLLHYGVPQGSVLGPQLFTVYTSPLGRIIRAHGLDCHLFADDSQLYVFVKPVQANVDGAIGRLEKCCHDIRTWMRRNFLKLNDDKTEVLLIGSRQQLSKIALPGVIVSESLIAPATAVRDLGAVFDTYITMVPT